MPTCYFCGPCHAQDAAAKAAADLQASLEATQALLTKALETGEASVRVLVPL